MARYTLIVGTRNWSSWSLRPFVALKATGQHFETVDIRLRQTEAPTTREQILKHSPAGKVPVLKIEEDGKTLTVWDSLAICETMAERHPEAGPLARRRGGPRHRALLCLRDAFRLSRCARPALHGIRAQDSPCPNCATTPRPRSRASSMPGSWRLPAYKGDFLFGHLSVADCMYAPVVSRFDTYGVEVPAPVRAYMDRVLALPAMQEWTMAAEKEVEAGLGHLPDPR